MTTIVWDGSSLSWDSQITQGDVKLRGEKGRKVTTPSGEALVVIAGNAGCLTAVCKLLAKGQSALGAVPKDSTAAILTAKGLSVVDEGEQWDEAGPWAGGTGLTAAHVGLHLGYSGRQACLLACDIDLHSGGPVHTVFKSKLRKTKAVIKD